MCLGDPPPTTHIFTKHTAMGAQIGRPSVQAHKYLHGILKMHKAKVGMRWIAGNHMQEVDGPPEHGDPKNDASLFPFPHGDHHGWHSENVHAQS